MFHHAAEVDAHSLLATLVTQDAFVCIESIWEAVVQKVMEEVTDPIEVLLLCLYWHAPETVHWKHFQPWDWWFPRGHKLVKAPSSLLRRDSSLIESNFSDQTSPFHIFDSSQDKAIA